jgi:hypothetical protein
MTAATPATTTATIETPSIDDNEWISTSGVGFLVGNDSINVHHACIKKGVELAYIGRFSHMRDRDLEAVLSPQQARTVRAYRKTEWQGASNLVLLLPNVPDGEAMRIVEFRGATINRQTAHPMISRSAFITLQQLFAVEESFEVPDSDIFPGALVCPELRKIQRFSWTGLGEDFVDATDRNRPREIIDKEVYIRLKYAGLRPMVIRGNRYDRHKTRAFCGFDVFRLHGIVVPDADVESYKRMMADAVRTVMGSKPADPALPTAARSADDSGLPSIDEILKNKQSRRSPRSVDPVEGSAVT